MKSQKTRNILLSAFALSVILFSANVNAQNTSQGKKQAGPGKAYGFNFVDANGDGICDNIKNNSGTRQNRSRINAVRPQDGTGNKYGYGRGKGTGQGGGTGICDGTGPKGKGRNR